MYIYEMVENCEQLVTPNGTAPSDEEVISNIIEDLDITLKDLKQDVSFGDAIDKITQHFDIFKRVSHGPEIGTWGNYIIKVITNRELSDKEVEELNEWFKAFGADVYWIVFTKNSFKLFKTE